MDEDRMLKKSDYTNQEAGRKETARNKGGQPVSLDFKL